MLVPEVCATLRFSTAGMPELPRAQAVRDLHVRERRLRSKKLEPIEPLEPLPDYPLHVDLTKRTLPGLAVVSGTLSGLRQAIRPSRAVANGEDDLLLGVNVSGCSTAHQRDRDLVLRDGDAFFATRDESGFTVTRPTPVRFVGERGRGGGTAGWPDRRHAAASRSAALGGADPARHLCARDCRRSAVRHSGAATARRHPHS